MDSASRGDSMLWRSIKNENVHHVVYDAIILLELASGVLIIIGLIKCGKYVHANALDFNLNKGMAAWGLTLSIIIWLFCFLTVGGEWFLMWQSPTWDSQGAALRMFLISGTSLVLLLQSDS
jgi:predicted small integral membrane protein